MDAFLVGVAMGLGVVIVEVLSGTASGIHYLKALRLGDRGLPLLLTYIAAFGASSLLFWLLARRSFPTPRHQLRISLCAPLPLVVGGLLVSEPGIRTLLTAWPWLAVVPASLAIALGIGFAAFRRLAWLRDRFPFALAATTFILAGLSTRVRVFIPFRFDDMDQLLQLAIILGGGLLLGLYLAFAVRDWGQQRSTRSLTRVTAFLLACSLLLVVAVPAAWLHPLAPGSQRAGRPSLLLIVIDTLRADAISPLGAAPEATPALGELARDSVVFERAHAAAPWTLPSFASILTSTYTREHHVGYRQPATLLRTGLDSSLPTIGEALRGAGYMTGASLTNTYLAPRYGLERGFATYEPLTWRFQFHPPMVFLYELFVGTRPLYVEAEAQSRRILDLIDRLERSGSPWFVLAHMFDPHKPYLLEVAVDAAADGVAHYRAEVSHVDRWIGEVLKDLRSRGLYDDLLIVFTADHGEELTETRAALRADGASPHGLSLYDELLHVPLLVKFPGGDGAGRRIAEPVSLVDVGPTLLRAAGIVPPASFRGRDLRDALSAPAAFADRTLYAGGLMELEQMDAVIRGSRKLVSRGFPPDASGSFTFDLAEDPGEARPAPLRADHAADAELFQALQSELARTQRAPSPASVVEMDPASREHLEALGYIE